MLPVQVSFMICSYDCAHHDLYAMQFKKGERSNSYSYYQTLLILMSAQSLCFFYVQCLNTIYLRTKHHVLLTIANDNCFKCLCITSLNCVLIDFKISNKETMTPNFGFFLLARHSIYHQLKEFGFIDRGFYQSDLQVFWTHCGPLLGIWFKYHTWDIGNRITCDIANSSTLFYSSATGT